MHILLLLVLVVATLFLWASIMDARNDIIKAIGERVDPSTQKRAEQLQKALDKLDDQVVDK